MGIELTVILIAVKTIIVTLKFQLNKELNNDWMEMKFKRYRLLSWTSILFPAANAVLHTYVNTKSMTLDNFKETSKY